jgi:quinol monooxygenase YgiN
MATLIAHIRVVEGAEARFESMIRALHRSTHDTEPAVRRYEYWRGAEPREYCALIAYDDFRGFITHQTSDHHESASPDLREVIESLRLEWVDPVAGASDLPSTEMQPALPDADDLTRRYTDRYAAQIAPWWLALR